jgi:hypothetical protein
MAEIMLKFAGPQCSFMFGNTVPEASVSKVKGILDLQVSNAVDK